MLRLNPAPVIISRTASSKPTDKSTESKDFLDEDNSQAWGGTFAALNENAPDQKEAEDEVITGYTSQGLPFQIAVHSYWSDFPACFHFIEEKVVPLISEYALRLRYENTAQVTQETINSIYQSLIAANNHFVQFTLSIAVTYENQAGELRCAGFGIGNTGLVLKKPDGTFQQLVTNSVTHDFGGVPQTDGFDNHNKQPEINRDNIIKRNSQFDITVEPGAELVGYTSLPKDMETQLGEARTVPHACTKLAERGEKEDVIEYGLNTTLLKHDAKQSFFQQVKATIDDYKTAAKSAQTETKDSDRLVHISNNCALASITIPTPALREKLRQAHTNDTLSYRIGQLRQAVEAYLDWSNKNAKGWRFSHFYHGEAGRIRAQTLFNSINDAKNEADYRNVLDQAYRAYKASGVSKHSLSRYIYDALHEGAEPIYDVADKDFSNKKRSWTPWSSFG